MLVSEMTYNLGILFVPPKNQHFLFKKNIFFTIIKKDMLPMLTIVLVG